MIKMASRKTTIFRQLIFNIAIPTLLALLVFAVINFQRTRSILVTGTDEKNRLLSNEVTKILKFQDIAFNLIDGEFNNRFKELSSLLVNNYFANTDNIKDLDLRAIANKIGMDPVNEDIYVISTDGIIINTTFKQDLGLNLFGLGEKMKKYLQGIFKVQGICCRIYLQLNIKPKGRKNILIRQLMTGSTLLNLELIPKQVDDIIQAIEDTKK